MHPFMLIIVVLVVVLTLLISLTDFMGVPKVQKSPPSVQELQRDAMKEVCTVFARDAQKPGEGCCTITTSGTSCRLPMNCLQTYLPYCTTESCTSIDLTNEKDVRSKMCPVPFCYCADNPTPQDCAACDPEKPSRFAFP